MIDLTHKVRIVQAHMRHQVQSQSVLNMKSGPDLTFFYWQTIALGTGLLVCNLPTLQPLYNFLLIHTWTGMVATKRTIYSWKDQYSQALSTSKQSSPSYQLGSAPAQSNSDRRAFSPPRHAHNSVIASEEHELSIIDRSKGSAKRTSSSELDLLRAAYIESRETSSGQ